MITLQNSITGGNKPCIEVFFLIIILKWGKCIQKPQGAQNQPLIILRRHKPALTFPQGDQKFRHSQGEEIIVLTASDPQCSG